MSSLRYNYATVTLWPKVIVIIFIIIIFITFMQGIYNYICIWNKPCF